ncbi:ribosomal protein S5 domain 2-type protein [Absidia repens]|uniref:Ribosomal protein S5 domain 2-type protein n=1 Tax=Absidia repens TaxID=90262 RepID=A0A1X2HY10_9FUNG|nr:ribosomal protein S5 domain 2-type protein [Absidia repens]
MGAIEENRELQEEERLAVCAIYGDSILQQDDNNSTEDQAVYLLTLNVDQDDDDGLSNNNNNKSPRIIVLRLFLPSTYPLTDMPVFEMASLYCGNKKITTEMVESIQQGFQDLFQPGQVVLFEWIQWLRDYIEDTVDTTAAMDLSLTGLSMSDEKDNNDVSDDDEDKTNINRDDVPDSATAFTSTTSINNKSGAAALSAVPSIFSSEPLVDRKSTFVAHVAHVKDAQQVQSVMETLLENKKIAKATHNIMAWRINLPGDRILQDNDDDGETAAGGRLMHLLQILDVKDVVVVVSRWYGGIQLGADRFKDINNCARKALEDCGYVNHQQHASSDKSNKKKGKK